MNDDPKMNPIFDYQSATGIVKRIKLSIRILYVSFVRFYRDECLMQASAVSYTTVVSLVPMLTVALAFLTITSGFNERQDVIFDEINTFFQKNEIKIDLSSYLETLKDIINSATQIGAVGFIVLIFSATAILRSFEASFNKIWRIDTPRPFADKIIFYFFILAVGPLLFAILIGSATKGSDKLRPSHLFSISRDTSNFLWIAGERGTLLKIDDSGKKISKLSDLKIDYENMICFDLESKTILSTCETPKLNKEHFIKVRNRNKTIVTISQDGVLLEYMESEGIWKITNFLNSKFKDFTLIDEKNVLILKESGEVFRYSNFEKVEYISLKNLDYTAIGTRVRFYDSKLGFILDESGNLWISKDGGISFRVINVTNNRLEDIAIINRETFVLVGEKGGIFKSFDGGVTWKDVSHKNITFTKIWSLSDSGKEILLILNNFDQILRSEDMGENWSITYTPENGALLSLVPINPRFGFKALNPDDDETEEAIKEQEQSQAQQTVVKGDILAVGEFGKISLGELKDDRVEFNKITGGEALFSLYSLIRITFPLLAVWLFFLMLYTLIPNTKVPIQAAMFGSIITSVIFLFFLYGFGIYIRSFSGSTFMIYRALAAIPLFLLGVYSVSNIILLGAEITATLQFKDRYLSDSIFIEKNLETSHTFYSALQFMLMIYSYQKLNKSLPSEDKFRVKLGIPSTEFSLIKKRLLKANLLMVSEKGILIPTRASDDLHALDIHKAVMGSAYSVPEISLNETLSSKMKDDFISMDHFISEKLKNITIYQLLN